MKIAPLLTALLVCHYLADMQQKPYWMLYGFDQLLHLLVIIGIGYCSLNCPPHYLS